MELDQLDKRCVYLKKSERSDNECHIILATSLDENTEEVTIITIVPDWKLKRGYKCSKQLVDEFLKTSNIPTDHKIALDINNLLDYYYDHVSPFGFEPNEN